MGKITKKKLKKHLKDIYKIKRKKKSLGKELEEYIKSLAYEQLDEHGDDGMEKIVIDNVSIEILSEDPGSAVSSAKPESKASGAEPAMMASASSAVTNCYYYCYVIGGRRICRPICW